MAAQAVFETAELLETILKGVDLQTLLLAQRVNRFWRDMIQSSQILKRALFFEADGGPALRLINYSVSVPFGGQTHHAACLTTIWLTCFTGYTGFERWTTDASDATKYNIYENPFMCKIFQPGFQPRTEAEEDAGIFPCFRLVSSALMITGGSWQQMYVASAPISRLECWFRNPDTYGSERSVVISAGDGVGVKIGEIVAAIAANTHTANFALLAFRGASLWKELAGVQ